MSIKIKQPAEIKKMSEAGKILAEILAQLAAEVKPGISTADIDKKAQALCKSYKVVPAFFGYNDFPALVCVGVDDVAIHGIPNAMEILKSGQIISIDMGIKYQGYFSDSAITVAVGAVDSEGERLINVTKLALEAAIRQAKAGNRVGDLSHAMQSVAELSGFNVIRDMVGHGIGKDLHEDPSIPCYGSPGKGELLMEGMTLAIEAMVNEGEPELVYLADGWTTCTADGKRSALFEHTVLVEKNGCKILTQK